MATIPDLIKDQVSRLSKTDQGEVLEFISTLLKKNGNGDGGLALLRFAGAIPIDDLEIMKQAIEEGCEQVDPHAW